jgi:hypothetical protein
MEQEREIMKALGESTNWGFRFGAVFWGFLGFFVPGWFMYRNIQLYKTMEDNEGFRNIFAMTEKIDLTSERQKASNDN